MYIDEPITIHGECYLWIMFLFERVQQNQNSSISLIDDSFKNRTNEKVLEVRELMKVM